MSDSQVPIWQRLGQLLPTPEKEPLWKEKTSRDQTRSSSASGNTEKRNAPQCSTSMWSLIGWPILGLIVALVGVWTLGVNILFLDEWELLRFYQEVEEGASLFAWAWNQHNEHRIVWVRLIFWLVFQMPEPDVRWIMTISQLLLWGLSGLLLLHLPPRQQAWFGAVVVSTFLSPVHHVNQLWAFQIQWTFLILGALGSLYCLTRARLSTNLVLCGTLFAFFGMLSTSAGIIVWINGAVVLGLRALSDFSARKALVVWILFSGAAVGLYFWNYQPPHTHPSLQVVFEKPLPAIVHWLALIGNLVGTKFVQASAVVGACGLFGLILMWWKHPPRRRLFEVGLISFGLGSSAAVSLGRFGLGMETALTSHYTLMSALFWLGLLRWVIRDVSRFPWVLIVFALLILTTANKFSTEMMKYVSNRQRGETCYQMVLKTPLEKINPDVLPFRDCKFLYPDRHEVISRMLRFQRDGITFH